MSTRGCLLVCLFVSAAGFEVSAVPGPPPVKEEGHGQLCRSNERFLSCGCQRTCADPALSCAGVCREGCFCPDGQLRNATGHCVALADCPPIESSKLQTSEPRRTDNECPPDEEYRLCEPCNRTCENPNPMCPAQCARGCFCRGELVRDKDGRCVQLANCFTTTTTAISTATAVTKKPEKNESSNFIKPIALQLTCGPHQEYNSCRSCERTCSSPEPSCRSPCSAGCFCQEGFLKAPSGQCVKLEDCPKAEVTLSEISGPTIEDCSSDEIYLSCGWCEPSCWEPRPECPRGVCTRGCLCRPPLLRHHSGHCVPQQECTPQKCTDPNEEFVCRYGCEARCDFTKCTTRQRRCVLGCHCRLGLYRDNNGKCVTQDNCQTYLHPTNATYNVTDNNNTINLYPTKSSIEKLYSDPPKFFVGAANLPMTLTLADANDPPKSVFDLPSETYTGKKPFADVVLDSTKLFKELLKRSDISTQFSGI